MARLDYGFTETDKELFGLELRLHQLYGQAAREMEEKCNNYFERFAREDEAKRKLWEDGKITRKEYGEWRTRKMLTGQRWDDMRSVLATDAANYDKIAMSFIRDKAVNAYCLNMNFATYTLEQQAKINTGFALYNKDTIRTLVTKNPHLLPSFAQPNVNVPLDKAWNSRQIQTAIAQGVLQGESIPQVAKRLQAVTGMDERAAIRNARTAMTCAQNAGRMDAANRMAEKGVKVKKGWLATLDSRTRDSHIMCDGEIVELDKPFSNGLMYPADAGGKPEEVYNCRCRLTTEYDKSERNWSDTSLRNTNKFKAQSYDEWKKAAAKRIEKKNAKMMPKSATYLNPKYVLKEPARPRREDFNGDDDAYYKAREQYRQEKDVYMQKRDEIIEEWLGGERQYNTAEDIQKWAASRGVMLEGNVENAVDKRLFDDVLNGLDEMFERFPEVKASQDAMRMWSLNFTNDGSYFAEASGGLNLGSLFKRADMAYSDVITGHSNGEMTMGDGTLKTIIRHEYGHNADWYCRQKFSTYNSTYEWKTSGKLERRMKAREQYDRELIELTVKHGSEYSRTNTLEAFAEGFAEYTSNPTSDYGKAFGKFFERWYYANPVE